MSQEIEHVVIRKVTRRLLPLLMVMYFISYLDRSNLGFAGLTMNKALGFSPTVFGLGGALFFIGYFSFQMPGNLALDRFGARRLTALIAFLWGVFATAMAFVWDERSFYVTRLLLGAAEAAFFPGMIFYISLWFPAAYRGRIIALFMVASPLSNAIGLPASALLGQLDGVAGLAGWQWIFIGEGLPAIAMAFVCLVHLTDRPADAGWLSEEERLWLVHTMKQDAASRPFARTSRGLLAFTNPRALLLAFGYFSIIMGLYGFSLWLPQIVRLFGASITGAGFLSAIPYVAAAFFMPYWGNRLDKRGDKGWHAGMACFLGALGLAGAALFNHPVIAMAALAVAAMGIHAAMPTFWTIPTSLFTGTAAAASIGFVSSMGHLGGFTGPYLMGFLREATGGFNTGLACLAVPLSLAGLVALAFRQNSRSFLPAAPVPPGRQ